MQSSVARRYRRKLARSLKLFGPKSSLHGFYHMYMHEPKSRVRQLIWLIILVAASSVMVIHMHYSIRRYLEKDTFVHVREEAEPAKFPAVTLCNMKPFADSIQADAGLRRVIVRYLNHTWSNFENWSPAAKPGGTGENKMRQLKERITQYLEFIWASGEGFDLGSMLESTTILKCSYEGVECDARNFTFISDPVFFNCFTFVPDATLPAGVQGLELTLFTDSALTRALSSGGAPVTWLDFTALELKHNNLSHPFDSLSRESLWMLNKLAARRKYQSDGVQVIVHDAESHHRLPLHVMEIETGVTAVLTISHLMVKRLRRPGIFECNEGPFSKVEYVTSFDSTGKLVRKAYKKLLMDYVFEAQQQIVFKTCGCFSHHFPFRNSTTLLCYYIRDKRKKQPSKNTLARIRCHDQAAKQARQLTYSLMKRYLRLTPCNSTQLSFLNNIYAFPVKDDIARIAEVIVKRFSAGVEFLPGKCNHTHRIFNFSDPEVLKELGSGAVSREQVIMKFLFAQNCPTSPQTKGQPSWCLQSNERLRQNLVRLVIKNWRKNSRVAQEYRSFEWPEALSEVGGIFGLWLGANFMTVFEFVEMVKYMFVTSRDSDKSSSITDSDVSEDFGEDLTSEGGDPSASSPPQLTMTMDAIELTVTR